MEADTVSVAGRLGYCPQEPQAYERAACDEQFELFGHADALSSAKVAAAAAFMKRSGSGSTWPCAGQLSGGTLAKLNRGLALGQPAGPAAG